MKTKSRVVDFADVRDDFSNLQKGDRVKFSDGEIRVYQGVTKHDGVEWYSIGPALKRA